MGPEGRSGLPCRSARGEAFSPEAGSHPPMTEPPMPRIQVPAADAVLGVKHPVLSHGYVVLVDYMGDDSSIVQAARVSYGQGTKSVRDDRGLIRYLLRHRHTTPFEMVEFKFLIRLPIYVARQFIRHRSASVNEYSARYSVVPDEFDLPPKEDIRRQSVRNRQGRDEALPDEVAGAFRTDLERVQREAYGAYTRALEAGVARETARLILPLSAYTEWYWKIDLHNLLHFLALRLDAHSQAEIRRYAAVMAELVRLVAPVAYEAFEDFTLGSLSLSRPEQRAVQRLMGGATPEAACEAAGIPLKKADGSARLTGEGVEFLAKLERIRGLA